MKSFAQPVVLVPLLAVLLTRCLVPVEYAIRPKYRLPVPTKQENLTAGGSYPDLLPSITATYGSHGFPLMLSPTNVSHIHTIDDFVHWIELHKSWLLDKLAIHGGLLFRGFGSALASNPTNFERLAFTIEPNLETEYLGTSSRSAVAGTKAVHTSSDYTGWRIIPSHLEMSFKDVFPQRIFFYAQDPNGGKGGETPLVDFRQVLRDLKHSHSGIVERFQQGNITYIRKYHDLDEGPCYNYFIHKDWQSMFRTKNATLAGQTAESNGFGWSFEKETIASDGSKSYRGTMSLINTRPPIRIHPSTGDEIWSNHMNVLHADSIPAEFAFAAQHLQSWKYVAIYYFFEIAVWLQSLVAGGKAEIGHHTTHNNGIEMDAKDVEIIKQTVWKNTILYQHQKDDVALLDNYRVGHGRQPYIGIRRILTAWH